MLIHQTARHRFLRMLFGSAGRQERGQVTDARFQHNLGRESCHAGFPPNLWPQQFGLQHH